MTDKKNEPSTRFKQKDFKDGIDDDLAATVNEAIDKYSRQERLVNSLERGISRRDHKIADLEAALEIEKRAAVNLQKNAEKLDFRLRELEQGFNSTVDTCSRLREQLSDQRRRAETAIAQLESTSKERDLLQKRLAQEQALTQGRKNAAKERKAVDQNQPPTLDELMEELALDPALGKETTVLDETTGGWEGITDDLVAPELIFLDDEKESEAEEGEKDPIPDRITRLIIARNGDQEIKYPLYKDEITIGRSRRNEIQIDSEYISRIHARIIATDEGKSVIEDVGSKNGIRVNAEPVERQELHHGDIVTVGTHKFEFVDLSFAE